MQESNVNFSSLPDELKQLLFSFLPIRDVVQFRSLSKHCLHIIDGFAEYWNAHYFVLFGNTKNILGRIKDLQICNNLLEENSPRHFQIIFKVHNCFCNFRNSSPLYSKIIHQGEVNLLMDYETPNTQSKDLYFFDPENKLRRIPFKNYINMDNSFSPQEIIQIPPQSKPLSMAPYSKGFFIGTHEGTIYHLNLSQETPALSPLLLNKELSPILTLQASEIADDKIILIVQTWEQSMFNVLIYQVDVTNPNKKIFPETSQNILLICFPKLISSHQVLCPLQAGGAIVLDLTNMLYKSLTLYDDHKDCLEPKITAICPLSHRIILSTKDGLVGWISKSSLEQDQLDLRIKIHWCNFKTKLDVDSLSPIGSYGFFIYTKTGIIIPAIPNIHGDYILGSPLRCATSTHPIGLENGKMIFYKLTDPNRGIHCIDYASTLYQNISKEGMKHFWMNSFFLKI